MTYFYQGGEQGEPLEVIDVPLAVRSEEGFSPSSVAIYRDRASFEGGRAATVSFDGYERVVFQRAGLACPYASVLFLRGGEEEPPVGCLNLGDKNRVLFCSGMFSYKRANDFAGELAKKLEAAVAKFYNGR